MNIAFLQQNLYWIGPLMILEIILKAFALWKSARRGQIYWYIALLIVNSSGILPIIYLLIYKDRKNEN